jgi:hypothetical protein
MRVLIRALLPCKQTCVTICLAGVHVQIAFTSKKNFGTEERERKWAHAQRTLHGLQPPEASIFENKTTFNELNQLAEEARRRAEMARYMPFQIPLSTPSIYSSNVVSLLERLH